MICTRSASPDATRRLTYSLFYGTNFSNGLTGQFLKSRYSVFADNCDAQAYHPYIAPVAPSQAPRPSRKSTAGTINETPPAADVRCWRVSSLGEGKTRPLGATIEGGFPVNTTLMDLRRTNLW